jgi:outer membrane receptor protein involved in Fe transport
VQRGWLAGESGGRRAAQQGQCAERRPCALNLRAAFKPSRQLEFYARINNALDRRYETYGVLAENLFPGGQLAQPALGSGEPEDARFIAPGAPRSIQVGMRYTF